MISAKLTLTRKKPETFSGDLLVCCFEQDKKEKVKEGAAPVGKELKKAIALGDFKGGEGSSLLLYPQPSGKQKVAAKRLLFVGLGKEEADNRNAVRERCRCGGGTIAAKAAELKAEKLFLCLPEVAGLSEEEVGECFVEGILLGDYRFLKYKKADKKEPPFQFIKEIQIYASGRGKGLRRGMLLGEQAALAGRKARDMANEPGNGWTPSSFADYAQTLSKKYKMSCTVLEKQDMQKLNMGGILGVNQGSSEPPKMVILEYQASQKAQTILLVGKGLTFDSGGVSLKPPAGMEDMKYDMCGGAAVLSMMQVVGVEKPKVNVVAIVPSTDNMGGSSALKPGDIIRHYGGTTSEIINTDAEGRLILADALAYGIEKYQPACVIDLATLTGAVIVGLGHHRTGLLGNNEELIDRLRNAGERCGEPLWQLPLDKDYCKQIESKVADIKNTGGRSAGTITAAAYLQKFVGEIAWAHMDIAGTAWNFTKKSYVPKGPSGTGVRTLVELVRSWKKI